VTDQHDPVDTWLEREVKPLLPPPGSLDRIRTRARRRKRNQAFVAVAGCAVIVGAAAAVPQIVSALQATPGPSHTAPPAALDSSVPSVQSSGPGSVSPDSTGATPSPTHSTLATGSLARDPVPPGFHPTSVTFVGNGSGGVVGAVIGQAGNNKCATEYCTSLAQTPDYGSHWYGLAAPETGPPEGDTGVSQVRFANLKDGWAFGPGLLQTTSGGWPWTPENTDGLRVTDLETADNRAFAVFAACLGTNAAYAQSCNSFTLYTSTPGSSTWSPAAVPASFRNITTSASSSATIAIGGPNSNPIVYVLTPSGELLSAPVASGSFTEAGMAPCQPGPAQADGAPSQAHLSAYPSLVLACDSGSTTAIWKSTDDGAKWSKAGVLNAGSATSLTSAPGGNLVVGTTGGLYYSADAGKQWQAASVASSPAGGFSYVGMTNATQGVALPADSSLAEIFVTTDGGHTWTVSPVRSP
jgi:hypothetical protein